ncbi:hypothetical protein ACG7TL_003187 [Trametes sanguinea]
MAVSADTLLTVVLIILNSRQSLAERGAGLSNDTSPFGISGVPDPSYRSNAMGERVNRRVPTEVRLLYPYCLSGWLIGLFDYHYPSRQLESGRSTDDQDSNDFMIELKRTELGASGTTVPVSLDRRTPTTTQYTFVGADRRPVDEDQKAIPV